MSRAIQPTLLKSNINQLQVPFYHMQLYSIHGLQLNEKDEFEFNETIIDMAKYSLRFFRAATRYFCSSDVVSEFLSETEFSPGRRVDFLVNVLTYASKSSQLQVDRVSELSKVMATSLSATFGPSPEFTVIPCDFVTSMFHKYKIIVGKLPTKEIQPVDVRALYTNVQLHARAMGDLHSFKDRKLRLFIAPIITHVSSLVPDTKVLVNDTVAGERVHAKLQFDFVARRGTRRVCIVEVNKCQIFEVVAKVLVGCDALAETEQSAAVCGIAVLDDEWVIYKRDDHRILSRSCFISMRGTCPTLESVKSLAEILHAIIPNE
ncbi:hypothetical protein AC1031_018564 [Aphanomyces cochlioides]|nr:hypothetical protein AC1031_018564 [Aphanomyces cochlioides]